MGSLYSRCIKRFAPHYFRPWRLPDLLDCSFKPGKHAEERRSCGCHSGVSSGSVRAASPEINVHRRAASGLTQWGHETRCRSRSSRRPGLLLSAGPSGIMSVIDHLLSPRGISAEWKRKSAPDLKLRTCPCFLTPVVDEISAHLMSE